MKYQDITLYSWCPKYYEFAVADGTNYFTKNDVIRSLFNWAIFIIARKYREITIEEFIEKARKEFPKISDGVIDSYARIAYEAYGNILLKFGRNGITGAGLEYPFIVDGQIIECIIDLIINNEFEPHTNFVIFDFSPKSISDEAVLSTPNISIVTEKLYKESEVPPEQLKLFVYRLYTSKLLNINIDKMPKSNYLYVENIVKQIYNKSIYRRISSQCQFCKYKEECFK